MKILLDKLEKSKTCEKYLCQITFYKIYFTFKTFYSISSIKSILSHF